MLRIGSTKKDSSHGSERILQFVVSYCKEGISRISSYKAKLREEGQLADG